MAAVRDNPDKQRFEMDTEAGVAVALYRRDGDVYRIYHSEVPRALEGRGLGSQLMAGVLDIVRAGGGKVTPLCGFVRHYFREHPDQGDLLA
ncbi:MAG: N-acetyltransferase [Pseudolabrys sp.]|nr:N-acetyltransferase [Pseudolabrys sp.]MBV9955438.1 N-acetyltransferase [Pseudolabrys sp.]